jgi:hypothetical protein
LNSVPVVLFSYGVFRRFGEIAWLAPPEEFDLISLFYFSTAGALVGFSLLVIIPVILGGRYIGGKPWKDALLFRKSKNDRVEIAPASSEPVTGWKIWYPEMRLVVFTATLLGLTYDSFYDVPLEYFNSAWIQLLLAAPLGGGAVLIISDYRKHRRTRFEWLKPAETKMNPEHKAARYATFAAVVFNIALALAYVGYMDTESQAELDAMYASPPLEQAP